MEKKGEQYNAHTDMQDTNREVLAGQIKKNSGVGLSGYCRKVQNKQVGGRNQNQKSMHICLQTMQAQNFVTHKSFQNNIYSHEPPKKFWKGQYQFCIVLSGRILMEKGLKGDPGHYSCVDY